MTAAVERPDTKIVAKGDLFTDTVRAHTDAERVLVPKRTTTDDLLFAVEWLEAFETDDPAEVRALAAVARKLRAEAERRGANHG